MTYIVLDIPIYLLGLSIYNLSKHIYYLGIPIYDLGAPYLNIQIIPIIFVIFYNVLNKYQAFYLT